jgi:hypothetical protein
MQSFSPTVSIALILTYSVINALAGPPIIPKLQHLEEVKSVSSEQFKGYSKSQLHHKEDVVSKQNTGVRIATKQKQPSEPSVATSFQLFSMYDKRGPWQPSFLPQAPPQVKSVKSSAVHQSKGTSD